MTTEETMLDLYIQAEKDVLAGKSITFRGESMDLEDLEKIQAGRKEWESRVNTANNGGKIYSVSKFI